MFWRVSQNVAVFSLALCLAGLVLAPASARPAPIELTVSAAISLKSALDDIKRLYTKQNPEVRLVINYGASGTLQLQIEQGAPVDLFMPAAPKPMDALESKGLLLEGTRKDVVGNEVVLIVPRNSSAISSFRDLANPNVKQIALGLPASVPAGQYAKEVLTNLGIYDAVASKAIWAKDVRQVLTYVETGNVDAGIVYLTDAFSSSQVKVAAQAPETSHAPVIYPVAVIKGSKNPAAAKQFAAFLLGSEAGAVFRSYGFHLAGP
ncbi:MAG TPA: molybdate ABC transporter substrate-binding protein [Candidatus Acidoferrum sp.]|nr:molybdate ABC transporter substrate-binding protein [Candidatus Acidoferrum sp.]